MGLFNKLKRTYPSDTIRIMEVTDNNDFDYITATYCIIDHIIKELLTPKRTYVFDPEYGSNIHKYIFDHIDENSVAGIVSEIKSVIDRYSSVVDYQIDTNYSIENKTVYVIIELKVSTDRYLLELDIGKDRLIPSLTINANTF